MCRCLVFPRDLLCLFGICLFFQLAYCFDNATDVYPWGPWQRIGHEDACSVYRLRNCSAVDYHNCDESDKEEHHLDKSCTLVTDSDLQLFESPYWLPWGDWTSAGVGQYCIFLRTRNCSTFIMTDCDGDEEQTQIINSTCADVVSDVPKWEPWYPWICVTLDTGECVSYQWRTCSDNSTTGCVKGESFHYHQCSEDRCEKPFWHAWGEWACVHSNNDSCHMTRNRECSTKNTTDCTKGVESEEKVCDPDICGKPTWLTWGDWQCMNHTNNSTNTSECFMERLRNCSTGYNSECTHGLHVEVDWCDNIHCFDGPHWTSWGSYECKYNNGHCFQTRFRNCSTDEPTDCYGHESDIKICEPNICPAAEWSKWGSFQCEYNKDQCFMKRFRSCSTGANKDCDGQFSDLQICNKTICPDPTYLEWGAWSCTTISGHCFQERIRVCSTGKTYDCDGRFSDIRPCQMKCSDLTSSKPYSTTTLDQISSVTSVKPSNLTSNQSNIATTLPTSNTTTDRPPITTSLQPSNTSTNQSNIATTLQSSNTTIGPQTILTTLQPSNTSTNPSTIATTLQTSNSTIGPPPIATTQQPSNTSTNQSNITTTLQTSNTTTGQSPIATTQQPTNASTNQSNIATTLQTSNTTTGQPTIATTQQPSNISTNQSNIATTLQTSNSATGQPPKATTQQPSNISTNQSNIATTLQTSNSTTGQPTLITTLQSSLSSTNQSNIATTLQQSITVTDLPSKTTTDKPVTTSNPIAVITWMEWGSYECQYLGGGLCFMNRFRHCSSGNTADCGSHVNEVKPCDKQICPGESTIAVNTKTDTATITPSMQTKTNSNALPTQPSTNAPASSTQLPTNAPTSSTQPSTQTQTNSPMSSTQPQTNAPDSATTPQTNVPAPSTQQPTSAPASSTQLPTNAPTPSTQPSTQPPTNAPALSTQPSTNAPALSTLLPSNAQTSSIQPPTNTPAISTQPQTIAPTSSTQQQTNMPISSAHPQTNITDSLSQSTSQLDSTSTVAPNATTAYIVTAALLFTVGTTPKPVICAVCDGPPEICEMAFVFQTCAYPNNLCLNRVTNTLLGSRRVTRQCMDRSTCYREWYLGSSDNDRCQEFDAGNIYTLNFDCVYCCTKDKCNEPLVPERSTLM